MILAIVAHTRRVMGFIISMSKHLSTYLQNYFIGFLIRKSSGTFN